MLPILRPLLLLAVASLGSGCPAPPPPECRSRFAGDPEKPLEALLAVAEPTDGGARLVEVKDGDRVVLQPPPQGGFVLYAGARVRNLDPCGATIGGLLRDPKSGAVRSNTDRRSTDFELEGGSPYLVPRALATFSTVANVPACPDDLGQGVAEQMLRLEVKVADRGGRETTVSRLVVPICPGGPCGDECRCICGPGYFPGKCVPDGGGGAGGLCLR